MRSSSKKKIFFYEELFLVK